MIKLDPSVIEGVQSAQSGPELSVYLRNAVKLEHSTIPPYLTAMFSLKPGTNESIARLIRAVVIEEMLHMTIAANILIAIGGEPSINRKDFVPQYPGPLPMSIGEGLIVGLERFSIPLVKNTFMAIEEPEVAIPVKPPPLMALQEQATFATIGQFYSAIKEKINSLGPSIFVCKTAPPQVVASRWFGAGRLFAIEGPASACRAIDVIKVEGEGTSSLPYQSGDEPAHYYMFGEIAAGRKLVQTPDGFAYSGQGVPFDPSGVWPLRPNCKIADFPQDTQARARIERFASSYTSLLNALHETFDGCPEKLDTAIGLMYDLRVEAVSLVQTPTGDADGSTVAPSFEYVDALGGMG